jgi:excisionase family DNA binding protein
MRVFTTAIQAVSPHATESGDRFFENGESPSCCHDVTVARFLKIEDVAEELAIRERQVYALLHSSALPAIQVGGRGVWRIEHDKLEEYMAGQYAAQRRRIATSDSRDGQAEPPAVGDTDA